MSAKNHTARSGIYQIRHIDSGKIYVGSAVSFAGRWRNHRKDLAHGRHHSCHLQRAWDKYGSDAFAFEVLEVIENPGTKEAFRAILLAKEQECLDRFESWKRSKGYNISPTAGSPLGVRHTIATKKKISESQKGKTIGPETRAKMSAVRKGRSPSPEHRAAISSTHKANQYFKGRKLSEETRAKMSAARKGHEVTPETRAKLSEAMKGNQIWKGRKHTPESLAKMSAVQKGRKLTPEQTARMAATKRGKKLSPEHVAKMAAALRGRKRPPEVNAKAWETRRRRQLAARSGHQLDLPLAD